jgi:predicted nucleic acid-binding protein
VALICDTGPLYAAMDEADEDHAVCVELIAQRTEQLVVPSPVLVELEWLASSRLGPLVFDAFLADVEDGTVRVIDLTPADYRRVRELTRHYSDLPLGFVDASVLAITERLQEPKLATLDHRHFRVVRPRHVGTLALLPEELRR